MMILCLRKFWWWTAAIFLHSMLSCIYSTRHSWIPTPSFVCLCQSRLSGGIMFFTCPVLWCIRSSVRSSVTKLVNKTFWQEAQLSQTDRMTLRVTEHFANSLKVTQNDTLEQGMCKSLLVFH